MAHANPASVQDPPIVIDAAYSEQLERLAAGVMRSAAAELGDRLMHELARATVLPSAEMPSDVVNIGSEVSFRDEVTGRVQTLTLVLPPDADIARRRVSVLTPVGAALIGLAAGASIGWETREGEPRRLTVLEVRPAPAPGA
jgi:regulator of nucleoside diphosphate kinase